MKQLLSIRSSEPELEATVFYPTIEDQLYGSFFLDSLLDNFLYLSHVEFLSGDFFSEDCHG